MATGNFATVRANPADHTSGAGPARREPTPRLELPERPRLRVVPTVTRRRRASAFAAVIITLLFAGMVALTAFQAQLAANQLVLDQVDQELRDEQAQYQRNRLQVAQLESPQHVLSEAKRLGMGVPDNTTYISSTADVVTAVLRSVGGGPESVTRPGGATRPDLAEYKKVMGAAT